MKESSKECWAYYATRKIIYDETQEATCHIVCFTGRPL